MKKLLLSATTFLLILSPSANAVVPDSNKIIFQILRNGNAFGTHKVVFDKNAQDQMVVSIDINMDFSIGPVTLFNYDHVNEEVWEGDQIVSLNSQTDDDGDDYNVNATWDDEKVRVTVNKDMFEAQRDVYSTSYWNPVTVQSDKLLNTQKGTIENITVKELPIEEIVVAGETRRAQPYEIEANVPIKIWYDVKTRQWVGLEFKVRGSQLSYKRLNPVQEQKNG